MPSAKAPSKPAAPATRTWHDLQPPLSPWVLEAVDAMGFERMTPVQANTIPLFTGNKDVVVEAVTGSGKTLSFLVPVVERLLRLEEPVKRHHIAAIVISPTRELATQIYNVLVSLLKFHPPSAAQLQVIEAAERDDDYEAEGTPPPTFPPSTLRVTPQLILGGTVAPTQDLSRFLTHSPNLLISTPGRLLELLSSPHVHCPQSSFEVLVLDEADRLLDMGFSQDITKILTRLPKQRRTGLFSASVSDAVDQLVRVGLRNPVRIAVKVRGRNGQVEGRTPASLRMTFMTTPAAHKLPALLKLLRDLEPSPQKTIAYLSTCAAVDYFQHVLPCLLPLFAQPGPNGLKHLQIIPLHGKHSPQVRQKNFTKFTTSTTPTLLLTTDLAARGLDIPSVDLTVQIDPPSDPKAFLHRAGRAGRAGRRGLATVFLLPGRETDEYPAFLAVRSTPVEPHTPPITTTDDEAADAMQRIRQEVLKDRSLYDKAQRGFVSWVRAYSKHEARSIFRAAELPWRGAAECWGLLRMPRMPELATALHWDGDASLGVSVDWDTYAYRDEAREKKRRLELTQPPEKAARPAKAPRSESWSANKEAKEERDARRDKRGRRREQLAESKMTDEERAQKRELERMVAVIRERNEKTQGRALEVGGLEDEFDGFSD